MSEQFTNETPNPGSTGSSAPQAEQPKPPKKRSAVGQMFNQLWHGKQQGDETSAVASGLAVELTDAPGSLQPAVQLSPAADASAGARGKDQACGFRRYGDQPLRPHLFHPQVEVIGERMPRVLVTPEVYKHICLYVEIASKEVGWMGTVSRTASGDFLIEETFLLEQEVHATETELAAEAIGKLTLSLIDSGEDGIDRANKLRFWGHSHVRMGTSPSSTDERTMERFGREGNPWYIRGIFNKHGRAEFTIYLFDRGLRINDAAWAVYDEQREKTPPSEPGYFSYTAHIGTRQGDGAYMPGGAPGMLGNTFPGPGIPGATPPPAPLPRYLAPSPELRAAVEAEFKAKVKERSFWGSWNAGEPSQTPSPGLSPAKGQGRPQDTSGPTEEAFYVPQTLAELEGRLLFEERRNS